MYIFMFDKLQLPVTPAKVDMKIKGNNKTVTLINQGEINQIKSPGLTEISFDAFIPNQKYPFANYKDGFKGANYYLKKFENLKLSKKPFQLLIVRVDPSGKPMYDTNIKVTLEEYTVTEDAEDLGTDVEVSFDLKQYKNYGVKTFKIKEDKKPPDKKPGREIKNSPKPKKNKNYTVKKGDCLWTISKRFYGKGSLWRNIYNANKKKIKNPNLIYPGQKFIIPPLKK